ncbi:Arsenate reductase [Nitrosotalea sinensis]|jgi:protein-tyrosine-phosphatase|uniref:Arsenate reductase n=1 Tax=Nitrosotalea sinensis TaxID=1499975 RepID=A0A2H1EHN3_9ARCH|nr:arsenate reductase ArsC [Candidatus Nitrosotalea sinensis]SHO46563.1 Arsenate reductase [Candidatus Nitrosotalea sinensis]
MKFLGKQQNLKKILFVCVENAGRSQMAEGFFRKYAPRGWAPISAGSRPTPQINPLAVQAMKEVGIDISNQKPKELSEELIRDSWLNISMGCIDKTECPAIFVGKFEDWGIEDPKGKPLEKVREIRNKIEEKVLELVTKIESN